MDSISTNIGPETLNYTRYIIDDGAVKSEQIQELQKNGVEIYQTYSSVSLQCFTQHSILALQFLQSIEYEERFYPDHEISYHL